MDGDLAVDRAGRRRFGTLLGGAAMLGCSSLSLPVHASSGDLAVRTRDAVNKFVGRGPVRNDPAAQIVLDAARHESVSVQVLLQAVDRPLEGVRLRPGPLRDGRGAEIAPDQMELFVVHYTMVDQPSDSRGTPGLWPDALMPLTGPLVVRTDETTVLWLRIRVDRSVPAGLYRGSVQLQARGRTLRALPVALTVFPVVLPSAPTLPFIVGLDFDSIHRFDGRGLDGASFARQVLPAYYAALRDAGAGPFVLFDAMPRVTGHGAQVQADFAQFDRRLQEVYGGKPQVPFPVPFSLAQPIPQAEHPPFSAAWDAAVVSYLGQVARHLEARGDLEQSFIYVQEADEPTTRDHIRRIAHLQRLIRRADARLRMVQTLHVRCFDCEEDAFDLLDSEVTLWTPNIAYAAGVAVGVERIAGIVPRVRGFPSNWEASLRRRRRGPNADVWWYLNPATSVLPGPHPAHPSLHIDHDGMAHRSLAWTAWAHRVSAVGHWMATFWRGAQGPWQRVPRGEADKGSNGDGVLVYPRAGAASATGQPDPGGPTPSIRLELIREGGDDHKLITLAEQAIGRRATEQLVAKVSPSATSYTTDAAVLRATRRRLLEAASR